MTNAKFDPKSVDGTQPHGAGKSHQEKVLTEVAPPPNAVEPDRELTPQEAEQARKKYLLTRFWTSARGYWGRGGDRLAWPSSIGLLTLIGINVGFQYGINVWNRGIFDAIERHDAGTVYFLSAVFLPLVLGSVALVTVQVSVRMMIQRRWRSWLTTAVIGRWLANGRYYQLNLIGGDHKNPEARISEDLRIATESPVDFIAGVISAFLSASTFIVVLWTIGGALALTIAGSTVTVPGFLVITAVLYAAITSSSMAVIGRHFVHVSEVKNQAEAEFRYTLTHVRENGEVSHCSAVKRRSVPTSTRPLPMCSGNGHSLQASTCAQLLCPRGRACLRQWCRFCFALQSFSRAA